MKKILFVCLGNICRSPCAEAIMKAKVEEAGLSDSIWVDSAGTSDYHAGDPADSRMSKHAARRGYDLTSISRGFEDEDFEKFDYIVTMDGSNYLNIRSLDSSGKYEAKVFRMTDFCKRHQLEGVPDPYYGGDAGFEHVVDILEDACVEFLKKVKAELN